MQHSLANRKASLKGVLREALGLAVFGTLFAAAGYIYTAML